MTCRILFIVTLALMACGGSPQPAAAHAQSSVAPESLDRLLAPVALYPDQLLGQILMSAATPESVVELNGWLAKMSNVKGSQLQDAALKAGFEPSLVALSLFPQVVAQMAADVESTRLLGHAFAADRGAVFASIQRLRRQAQTVGTLKTTPQQEVTTRTTSGGEEAIVIEPTNPQVVYVPQYNPQVVYTQAPTVTNTVVIKEDNSTDEAIAAGLIGFTAGIAIGAAMDNNYYHGPYGWRGGGYMYNDAWDDYYDARDDARDDWQDHREDLADERGDRAGTRQEQRTDRQGTTQEQRTDRQQTRQETRPSSQSGGTQRTDASAATAQTQRAERTGSAEARGYGEKSGGQSVSQRSGGGDAFSGYSSGKSERSASARGQQSRSSSRSSGGGRRR